jgi:hypothetical protein
MKLSWRDALYLLPLPFVTLSFILIPMTNDMRIFQGVARVTDYFGAFPFSLDRAWEIKPLGNRLMEYLIYKLVTLITPFGSPLYSPLVKLTAAIIVLLCCWYFASKFKEHQIPMFAVCAYAFLTVMNFLALQAEWWSALFSLVALGLLLSDKRYAYALCGVVLLFIFLLKGITGLLIIPILCAAYLLDEDFMQKAPIALFSFFFSGLCFFLLCLTIFPNAIPDMLMSAQLARVGQHPYPVLINSMFEKFFTLAAYLPAFLFAVVIGFYQYATVRLPKMKYLALTLLWLFPLAIVFAMGEFFLYHYAVLIFPAIVSIAFYVRNPPTVASLQTIFSFCIFTMIILWLIFTSTFGLITAVENQIWTDENKHAAEAKVLFDIEQQPSTLYLDTGTAAYFFHTNTSCRYTGVLPVQRNRPEWNTTNLRAYADLYSCIMAYDGEYIIGMDWWFGRDLPQREEIYRKIDNEYTLVYNQSWDIYQRKPDFPPEYYLGYGHGEGTPFTRS